MSDAWRLARGTLTALPGRPPAQVTPATCRSAILLAPLAVVPLGLGVVAVLLAGDALGLPPTATGLLAVGLLALGTRAFHWDGLSDVADGLTASHDPACSLAVMKTGTSGPAGTLATVLVAGLQAAGLGALSTDVVGAVAAGVLVCLARCGLWLACADGVPGARDDGIGAPFVGVVPRPVAALGAVLLAVLPAVAVGLLVRRCVRRFGGVVGDVMGASVETAFAALVLTAAAVLHTAGAGG